MNIITSYFQAAITRHPEAPKINTDLAQMQISFRLSEDMKNYLLLLDWMRQIKYGALENTTDDQLISKYSIKSNDINTSNLRVVLINILKILRF